jgi:outer membrane protein assembly factor BamB
MQKWFQYFFLWQSALVLSLHSEGVDWYRWRGPDLNGISQETGWFMASPVGLVVHRFWKASVGHGYSSVTISKGRLYTMGTGGGQETVYCLDANTGAVIWKHSYAYRYEPQYYDGGSSSTPTIDGNQVYTLSQSGDLFCFDAVSGKILWSKDIAKELSLEVGTWGFAGSPLVEGEMLVLNAGTQGAAFEKNTGKLLWLTGTNAAGYSSVVPFTMGSKKAFALFAAKALVAVAATDGKELWRFPWKTSYDCNVVDPIIHEGKAFIASAYGSGCALVDFTVQPPKEVWRNKNMNTHFSTCVLLGGYLYGVDGEADKPASFKCLDWQTGAEKWSEKDLGMAAFIVAEGALIILTEKGELVIAQANPAAFKALVRAQVLEGKCWTTPVFSQDKIYCRNAKGDLVSVKLAALR